MYTNCTLFRHLVAPVIVVIRSSWSGGLILSVYNGLTEIVRVGAEPDGVILLIENHMADCASTTVNVDPSKNSSVSGSNPTKRLGLVPEVTTQSRSRSSRVMA